ncbi:MAG: hypothetical protein GY928_38935 [Colwellia sp.]|nr:hypothetical protein [Colwellia sp.]
MINFIENLRHGKLLTWNEYVGNGHPGMYFGHYPITQNTIFYMIFGYSDFTYYFTKFISLAIQFIGFIYVCKYFKLGYLYALSGTLIYFCINFVIRIYPAETVGNLFPLYPILVVLVIHIVADNYKSKLDIVIFSLVYVFWLLGGNLTYVPMHVAMLSLIYLISLFAYHYKPFKLIDYGRFTGLYLILFIIPLSAALYQYYFVYDVVSYSNRFKSGLIVSPFESIAWKQLLVSFQSSTYFWVGLYCCIIYVIVKILSKTKPIRTYSILFLLVIPLLYYLSNLSQIEKLGDNLVTNGDFSDTSTSLKPYKSTLLSVPDGQAGNCIKITANENATGYGYFAIPTQIGKKYKFAAYYKRGSASNCQIKVGSTVDGSSLYYSGTPSNPDWVQYGVTFTASKKETYITLINLTSVKGQTSLFDTVSLHEIEQGFLGDYVSILGSDVFKIALVLYVLIVLLVSFKESTFRLDTSLPAILNYAFVFIAYVSLLSYYFFSPENIIGDVNGYDYDLFRELSPTLQVIFCLVVMLSIEDYHKGKQVKIIVLSLIVLYLIRSHFTIPLMRFTGIIWYATRDGSIFSILFAILFMFGLKNILNHLSSFCMASRTIKYVKYAFLLSLIILMARDSHNKFYQGTSHRFVYMKNEKLVRPEVQMDQYVLDLRSDMHLLNNKLLELDRKTDHYYKLFSPSNSYVYLAGSLQNHKIHEAFIYESSITGDLQDFYEYTILEKAPVVTKELKDAMPYFLFTSHVHAGINLHYKEIPYGDFFMFSPKDAKYIKRQNIEFLWDLTQVKYVIIDSALSKVLDSFTTRDQHYKLLGKYPKLGLNLYEITKEKEYSTLAVLPVDDGESYDQVIEKINSRDIEVLKQLYSKLVFLDKDTKDFTLSSSKRTNNKRLYEIKSKRKGIFIELESWNKNWELEINDKKETVQKAFQIFKGIKIEPGLNKIEFSYRLKFFNLLFLLSLFVILGYTVLLVKYRYSDKHVNLN